ncbi:MAG TPA: transcription-repair coupling factor, partial [Candidatus Eisenbacteria bacterium]|nr:transcription-repair coupling factor [Candidatus Eisenbacteria bacterium]
MFKVISDKDLGLKSNDLSVMDSISDTVNKKLLQDKKVREIIAAKNKKSFQIVGLNDSAQMSILSVLHQSQSLLLIVPDELKARELLSSWQAFNKTPAYILPAKQYMFTDVVASSKEIELQRLSVLQRWIADETCLLITTASAMLDWYPSINYFRENTIEFRFAEDYDFDEIQTKLEKIGYERIGQIEAAGQYAIRGDLIDIGIAVPGYPSEVKGIRLSFFDDELEDLREFDPDSQRSIDNLEEIHIPPAREWLIDSQEKFALAKKIRKVAEAQMKDAFRAGADKDKGEAFMRLGKRDAERIEQGMHISAMDRWLFLLKAEKNTLLNLAENLQSRVALSEILQIQKRLDAATTNFYQQIQAYLEKGQVVEATEKIYLKPRQAWQGITELPSLSFAAIDSSGNGISGAKKINLTVQACDSYRSREHALIEDLDFWTETQATVIIFAGSESRAERLEKMKQDHNFSAIISKESLHKGFAWKSIGLIAIGTQDLFGSEKKRWRKQKHGLTIDFISDLKAGDYVVHEDHGIGMYKGLKTLDTGGKESDYLQISYAGTDQLYISVEQLEQIQKYISAGGGKPKLSKLDSQSWTRLKTRARESIKVLATNLIDLYKQRMQLKGYPFSPDTVWQKRFEEDFPYLETEDQMIAIDEIKKDMESSKVMDRLLCGDVGFGKTEVAFRAMFKAAIDSKQAALLVPTTVLAQQHYDNLIDRLADFPIKLAMLSRFVSLKERKKILRGLENGEVDLVIGTHRILSKDVKFKNLGLLIIDEEQRFGVDHKEGLKARYPNVDVLSMTATPIPRTLHMTISGIRDISILESGPTDRRAIQTYVMEYEQDVVEEAILREISRQGQVFYLFNNTYKIAEKTRKLRDSLPGLRVEYAHGQMSEKELEKVIEDFISGEFDVLICTTIIESGIDMPNVNTLIIEDADRLGLAQLYQIRGRVGRSEKQAYAYITYNPDRILNEDASKRLAAIRDYTELGSGFKIALRDLEVRGAGNLLGAEQHGHMEAIGYELYCRMLEEKVNELQGQSGREIQTEEAQIELKVDGRIPESYISTEGMRLNFYRKISRILNVEDYYDVIDELIDRFGNPPQAVLNLCNIALIRSLAGQIGI